VLCLQYTRSLPPPFSGQSVRAPLVLVRNSCEQRDRKRMEVKLFQNVVDRVWPFAAVVGLIEGATGGIHR